MGDTPGYPLAKTGYYPLARTGWGTPSPHIRQSSIASTCYTVGGMPLVFTPPARSGQEVPDPADGGYFIPGLDRGYPRVLPGKDWMGYPQAGLNGVPPPLARTGWGTPTWTWDGVSPPARTGWGTPHPH